MRKSTVLRQLAAVGMTCLALTVTTTSTASAENIQAGVWQKDGHDFNIRTAASTSAAKIVTIKDPDTRVPCGASRCTRNNNGGTYTCWSGGPTDNDWLKVRWAARPGGWLLCALRSDASDSSNTAAAGVLHTGGLRISAAAYSLTWPSLIHTWSSSTLHLSPSPQDSEMVLVPSFSVGQA